MRKLFFILAIINIKWCYAEGGFYAGIGAGYSSINNVPQSGLTFSNGSAVSQNAGAFTGGIYGGYDFNRIVGVQLDYDVAFNGQTSSYNATGQIVDAAVLLHLPFGFIAEALNGLSVFAKGGIGYTTWGFGNVSANCATCLNPQNSASGIVPVYGFGIEYGLKNMGIRAEWDYSGNVSASNQGTNQVQLNANTYLLSILYHF
jgi:hypothetical protein